MRAKCMRVYLYVYNEKLNACHGQARLYTMRNAMSEEGAGNIWRGFKYMAVHYYKQTGGKSRHSLVLMCAMEMT